MSLKVFSLPTRKMSQMSSDRSFAVFILSHGRPNNVRTLDTIRRCGYTGDVYILVDNEDDAVDEYKKNYGDKVIVFDKEEAATLTDAGDNFGKKNSVVFARNINFKIAKEMGLTHFWQLDDDYGVFRWVTNNNGTYISANDTVGKLDKILISFLNFLDSSGAKSDAFAQGGDMIGGANGNFAKRAAEKSFFRKVMNTFLYRVDRPVRFYARMNDDVNMYIVNGNRGDLFVTCPRLRVEQANTQSAAGGLTEMYLESGTYVKSFYTVMYAPYCTTIKAMGVSNKRLHHRISWKNAVPKIISEDYKK